MGGYVLILSGNTVRTPLNPEFPPTFFMKTVVEIYATNRFFSEFPRCARIISNLECFRVHSLHVHLEIANDSQCLGFRVPWEGHGIPTRLTKAINKNFIGNLRSNGYNAV